MKLAKYVADFIARQNVKHVFAISGGASLHLIHAIAEHPDVDYICPQHEQAGAMAADAYSRVSGNLGVAISTSGPGATNMLTGVCCAYYDSVPVLYLTGQVTTFRAKGDSGVRQMGFQETDVIDIYKPVTKYAVQVREAKDIRYELEKACYLAREGRPGPVLVDIPDDIQRMDLDPAGFEPFSPPDQVERLAPSEQEIATCIEALKKAVRPVLILGWGVRIAGAMDRAVAFAEALGIPVALTWAAKDALPDTHDLLVGTFGTHGMRDGNFTVQNADLLISIGARLDTREAGSPITTFARGAQKIIVDIDPCELGKFGRMGLPDVTTVNADAGAFIDALSAAQKQLNLPDITAWKTRIAQWKERYGITARSTATEGPVDPYAFVACMSDQLAEDDVIVMDTGCCLAWMMQDFRTKPGQRLFHDFNNTAMGYALPASVGASFALGKQPIICITGDGSLQMNLQELATVIRHQLPIKIFLINNHGFSMIQQTQDQWLGSRYEASSVEGGLAFPDFRKLSEAYGFPTYHIDRTEDIDAQMHSALQEDGPAFINVEVDSGCRVLPQVKYGRPIEDSEPLLTREEFLDNMIVPAVEESLQPNDDS